MKPNNCYTGVIETAIQRTNNSWAIEFDKWFNHGTKLKPRFLLSSDFYKEVKDFITKTLQQQREVDLRTFNSAIDCASSDAIEVVGNSALAYDQAINGVRKYLKKFYKQENK